MQAAHDADRLPILTGGTGLYFASLTEGLADIPDPGPQARAEARALLAELGAAGAARPARRGRSRHRRQAASPTTASASPAPGRCGAAPASASPPGRRSAASPRPGASPPSCSIRRARHCAPPSPPASPPCWPRARWTRCAPCWRSTSTRRCRPCAPTACRSCPPTCAAKSRLEEAGRRTELVTGQYTKRQATWFRHHALAARTHTIHARFAGLTQFSERNLDEIVAFIQAPG